MTVEALDHGPGASRTGAQAGLPIVVHLFLLTVILPIGFQAGSLALTTLRVLLLILVLPLTAQLLMRRFGPIRATDVLFLGYLLWSAVALAVNSPDQLWSQMGSAGVEFWGGYLVGRAYVRTPEAFLALCRTLILIVCCLFPLALFEAETGRPLILEALRRLPGVTTPSIHFMEPRLGLERVQMSFAHAIHWGLFCSVVVSLVFVGLKDHMAPIRRWILSLVAGGSGFLALSSGAFLAVILQVFMISWSIVFRSYPRRWWGLLALFAVGYVVVDLLSNRTPLDVLMSYATFSPQTAYWRKLIFRHGMENVWANPLFGLGFRDWVRPDFMAYNSSVDNFWLLTAMRYGIPAFLCLAIGYGHAIVRIMRRDFSADPVLLHIRRAWVFTFLGLSFTLSTVHIWTNIYAFVFFMFGAGLWIVQAQPGRDAAAGGGSETAAGTRPPARHTRFSPVPRGGAAVSPASAR